MILRGNFSTNDLEKEPLLLAEDGCTITDEKLSNKEAAVQPFQENFLEF